MLEKFNRNYRLTVEASDGSLVEIKLPFTVEFNLVRTELNGSNISTFKIYNLSDITRNLLRKDVWLIDDFRLMSFHAGYGDNLAAAFVGNVSECYSERQGVNYVTTIECYDASLAFTKGISNQQFPANTSKSAIIRNLMGDLPHVEIGAIGDYPDTISRGNSFVGSTTEILRELTDNGFFIDNGKAYALNENEAIQGDLLVIDSSSGLIGTPKRRQSNITLDMIFEPRLKIGQRVLLKSLTGVSDINGFWRVNGITHKGTISSAVAGDAITTVQMWYGEGSYRLVPGG